MLLATTISDQFTNSALLLPVGDEAGARGEAGGGPRAGAGDGGGDGARGGGVGVGEFEGVGVGGGGGRDALRAGGGVRVGAQTRNNRDRESSIQEAILKISTPDGQQSDINSDRIKYKTITDLRNETKDNEKLNKIRENKKISLIIASVSIALIVILSISLLSTPPGTGAESIIQSLKPDQAPISSLQDSIKTLETNAQTLTTSSSELTQSSTSLTTASSTLASPSVADATKTTTITSATQAIESAKSSINGAVSASSSATTAASNVAQNAQAASSLSSTMSVLNAMIAYNFAASAVALPFISLFSSLGFWLYSNTKQNKLKKEMDFAKFVKNYSTNLDDQLLNYNNQQTPASPGAENNKPSSKNLNELASDFVIMNKILRHPSAARLELNSTRDNRRDE